MDKDTNFGARTLTFGEFVPSILGGGGKRTPTGSPARCVGGGLSGTGSPVESRSSASPASMSSRSGSLSRTCAPPPPPPSSSLRPSLPPPLDLAVDRMRSLASWCALRTSLRRYARTRQHTDTLRPYMPALTDTHTTPVHANTHTRTAGVQRRRQQRGG